MEKSTHSDKTEMASVSEQELVPEKERKRSKSEDSRGSSISSEMSSDLHKGARRRSKESAITEERSISQRISKAIEEEDAFLDYIKALPAMSNEKIEAYKKSQLPVYKRSTSEVAGGIEHLDNLYRLMEHLGQLRIQNSKLQERVKYLENIAQEDVAISQKVEQEMEVDENKQHSRNKRSTKCKSSHYGLRQTFMKSTRERSRSVGVEEIMKSTTQYRLAGTQEFETRGSGGVKAKVSKWTKVKEAFRWEKASNGVLPEAKSQDSGLGVGDDVRYLRVPQMLSDNSSFSVSPADSVLSGQSLSQPSGKVSNIYTLISRLVCTIKHAL
ncbi:hypothetical protein J6590_017084 [Homalodisca vitripennis]|nr:hypothetical protein J6590_017084 [Homalodisca vitripennis]